MAVSVKTVNAMLIADEAASLLGGPLAEYLAKVVPQEAYNRHKAYSRIAREDYEQIMWMAVFATPDRFSGPWEADKRWLVRVRLRQSASAAIREDDRYQRAAKAAEAGYRVEDEQFYSTGMLAKLLPVLIEAEFDPAEAVRTAQDSTDAAGVHVGGSTDPQAAETYMAILIDVCAAWARLPRGTQRLLWSYYQVSQEDTQDGRWERQQLASTMGLTEETLRQRAHRAVGRLQRELGGKNPW